jgi:hypothetical protein
MHSSIATVEPLGARIDHVVASLGVLLVLVTLFAGEQARSLDAENKHSGGARRPVLVVIVGVSAALAAVSVAGILAMRSITGEAWTARESETSAFVLVLIWLLLFPLAIWELSIAISASGTLWRKLRRPKRA